MSNRTIIEINHDLPAPVRVVEEMARAMLRSRGAAIIASDDEWPLAMKHYRRMVAKYPDYADGGSLVSDAMRDAKAALMVLRRHGFVTDLCIEAIYAEEDANGEPRSSAMQVGK